MKKKKLLSLLAATMLATAATTAFTACTDSDDIAGNPSNPEAQSFSYQTTVFGISDSQRLSLDSLTADITSVTSSASWVKATSAENSKPRTISIVSTAPETPGATATVFVTDANGNRATVTVNHRLTSDGDAFSGINDEWIKEWYKFTEVHLEGFDNAQQVPWSSSGAVNTPEAVRFQYKPEHGWEMAFSYLNDKSLKDRRYFALYNKWTGQMRIWTYVANPKGWGSDWMLNIYFGKSEYNGGPGEVMYPLYHVFEYGIPTCHKPNTSLYMSARLVDKQTQTFQTWLSPYKMNPSINPGWHCFEFDMSGYVPEGSVWLDKGEYSIPFKIYPETINETKVTLNGALIGSAKGSFESDRVIQQGGANAASGIMSSLGNGLKALGGMATGHITTSSAYANLMANGGDEGIGAYFNPLARWGGFACNIAGGILGFASGLFEEPTSYQYIPGKIDLTLDASIGLNGYLSQASGNDHVPASISGMGVYSANGDQGHVGKGLWGLAEDPVVYVDTTDIISSQNSFNLLCTKDGYSNTSFADYDARIVYAFDPTSIKINLNSEMFKNIQDVTVTANVGVFTNLAYENTKRYQEMLMFGDRLKFSLNYGKTSGTFTLDGHSTPVVARVGLDELADGTYETAGNCTVVTQKKSDGTEWQRFHGRLIDIPSLGKQIIVDPQVYIPYTADKDGKCTFIGSPAAPDFVVRVDVQFSAEVDTLAHDPDRKGKFVRRGFQYSKLFIPKVVGTDYKEMSKVYDRLKAYARKCENEQSVNTLQNPSGVSVRHPNGHQYIGKTLRLLKRVCE